MSDIGNILEFTLLFSRHKVKIFNYVTKMVSDRMTAEDIVQNVFLKLYENLDVIRNKESIHYWLFRTARNEIYGWFRKQKSYKKVFDPADIEEMDISSDYSLSDEIEIKEISNIISKELDYLPENQKEVFVLKEYGGLSYKEISDITETGEDLVKSRLYKVRQKLIQRLSKKVK
jgi:RNA polymerase sigma-70 factor, ECF subfamily